MATVINSDLDTVRRELLDPSPNYSKTQVNKAIQAIEDWFEKPAVKQSLSTDIDLATSPFTFTAQQKMKIIRFYLKNRFSKGE